MENRFTCKSIVSSSPSYPPIKKLDIITFAMGNPANKMNARLSKNNQHLLGLDASNQFVKRHNLELQRCSQFYSLASIYNETATKNKHGINRKNVKKIYSTGRKYMVRLFICS
ncbi:unnamed protein product [Rotaria socialis]|uniref:Uncharacterized protein n=1 Tax=Rotaria socialis TaxID=392032 RepID=A0A820KVQ5_9BILA|nr:unnamed protein product [Rotaria socialis]CAF4342995.1 unnamed protein product [Rotaria socialis]